MSHGLPQPLVSGTGEEVDACSDVCALGVGLSQAADDVEQNPDVIY